jgi:SnoaL-like domain
MNDVELLLAERDIRNVVLRYCRGIDRMDLALVRSCYHSDAQEHHGEFAGGIEAALAWVWEVLETYESTLHVTANMLVEVHEATGASARCETYGEALHFPRADGGRPGVAIGFRFIDDLERRPSADGPPEWRFSHRVATTEWIRKFVDQEYSPIPERLVRGRRDRSDPLYAPWPGNTV